MVVMTKIIHTLNLLNTIVSNEQVRISPKRWLGGWEHLPCKSDASLSSDPQEQHKKVRPVART